MTQKPNFLLFITDQHRADHLGCYGNPVLRTPHIDGIAQRGLRFERFYVATPICMPNRATLMTGRMPSLHGARHNGIPLSLNATTFTDILAAGGYRTALIGKCHLQSMSPGKPVHGMPVADPDQTQPPEALREADRSWPRHGRYDQELSSSWKDPGHELDLPYYGFQHVELCINHGDRVAGHYSRWLEARHPGSDKLRGPDNQLPGNNFAAPQAWRTALPEALYPTQYIAERTMAYLEGHAKAGGDTPFFIQCSFPDPHHPFTPPGKYWDMYDPADVTLAPSFHQNSQDLPPHLAALHRARDDGKANRNGQRVIAITEREAREAIALNYGMIAMIDDRIGMVLAKLRELGLDRDTVVIFTTDHGDFMGDHQLLLKGALHYQGLVRVPFIWADPLSSGGGETRGDLAGTIDISRTVLSRAGLASHHGDHGRDLMAGAAPARSMLIEDHQRFGYMGFGHGFRARSLMTARYRLTLYQDQAWGELYDLQDDPHEMRNLWDDPAHRPARDRLMEALLQEMMAQAETSPLATHHGP
jgi:arylsulfatase A-like enzyme